MTLAGRTALVTGAATGIGAAIAHGLAHAGARVVAADLAFEAGTTGSGGIEQVRCDVADQGDVRRLVAGIEARHGGVDILVNNAALAGAVEMSPFERITPEEWTRVMTVNTLAPFLCAQAVVPGMRRRRWGRIINLTSAVVFQAVPNNLHYVSSKGAIAVMTRSLAREVGRDGITVNGLAPGLTITPGIADNPGYSKEMRERIVASRCLPREEEPDDLVGACLFLAGEGAAFMTGQIVTVDGGNAFH